MRAKGRGICIWRLVSGDLNTKAGVIMDIPDSRLRVASEVNCLGDRCQMWDREEQDCGLKATVIVNLGS